MFAPDGLTRRTLKRVGPSVAVIGTVITGVLQPQAGRLDELNNVSYTLSPESVKSPS